MPVFNQADFDQMRTCEAAYRRLGRCIAQVVLPATKPVEVLDIGCGLGFVLDELRDQGGVFGVGVDFGEAWSAAMRAQPKLTHLSPFPVGRMLLDITKPVASWGRDFDLVICTETAEHLEAEYADTLVGNVVSAMAPSGRLVWSAAQPGQEWEGHVNLQPSDYWLAKLNARGVHVMLVKTLELRTAMCLKEAQHWTAADNFFVLERR